MFSVHEKYRRNPDTIGLSWFTLCVSSRLFQTGVYSFLDPYTVWIPAVKVLVCSGDDCFTDYEPLYPGYIFVGIPTTCKPAQVEKAARGYNPSFSLLKNMNGSYHSMTSEEIATMVEQAMPADKKLRSITAGSKVKIISGPLTGTAGIVKKASSKDTRVKVKAFNKNLELRIFRDHSIFLEPYVKN